MKAYRKGDLVSLLGVVEFDERQGEAVIVKVEQAYNSVCLPHDALTLRRQKITPGEEVKYDGERMTALAADGRELWVRKYTGETMILDVNDVDRMDPPSIQEAAE